MGDERNEGAKKRNTAVFSIPLLPPLSRVGGEKKNNSLLLPGLRTDVHARSTRRGTRNGVMRSSQIILVGLQGAHVIVRFSHPPPLPDPPFIPSLLSPFAPSIKGEELGKRKEKREEGISRSRRSTPLSSFNVRASSSRSGPSFLSAPFDPADSHSAHRSLAARTNTWSPPSFGDLWIVSYTASAISGLFAWSHARASHLSGSWPPRRTPCSP